MALQTEQACIRYSGDPAFLGKPHGHLEVTPANRDQDRGVAQLHTGRRGRDAGDQRGKGRIGVARGFLCRGETLAVGGIRRLGGDRLGEAGDRIRRALQLQHQDAKQRLGRGIAAIEDHRFSGIRRRSFPIIHLHAEIRPALAQPGIFWPPRHALVQLCLREVEPFLAHCQPRREHRQTQR